ncbi:MAG: SpoIIE family protein phosphatase [Pseudomonadota bacterium]
MKIESLAALPYMDLVIDMQRDLSAASTEADIVFAFGSRFREMTGATHLLDLDVEGLPDGQFRLRDLIAIGSRDFSVANAREASRWGTPASAVPTATGPVLSELITGGDPKYAREVPVDADPHLAPIGIDVLDLFAVPVFHRGRLDEWLIVIGPTGASFDNVQLRTGLANLNLLKRGIVQQELYKRVKRLSGELNDKIQEVADLQQALLPAPFSHLDGLEVAVSYRVSDVASGDYYDFREFDDGSLGIAVADVSGHGPASAVVMAMLRTMLSAYRHFNRSPMDVVGDMNVLLRDTLPYGVFVTAAFVQVDPITGEGRYLNAGHCAPRIRRADGTIERLDEEASPPLGILDDIERRGGPLVLDEDDMVIVFTDGLTEAPSADGTDRFGDDRLDAVIAACEGGPEALREALERALDDFTGSPDPVDDQCLVIARFHPPPE